MLLVLKAIRYMVLCFTKHQLLINNLNVVYCQCLTRILPLEIMGEGVIQCPKCINWSYVPLFSYLLLDKACNRRQDVVNRSLQILSL